MNIIADQAIDAPGPSSSVALASVRKAAFAASSEAEKVGAEQEMASLKAFLQRTSTLRSVLEVARQ